MLATHSNGCSAADAIQVIFDFCSGLQPAETNSGPSLFPNPASQWLTIRIPESEFSSGMVLSITDPAGKEVAGIQISNPMMIMNLPAIAKGVYFFQVLQDSRVRNRGKLLIQ